MNEIIRKKVTRPYLILNVIMLTVIVFLIYLNRSMPFIAVLLALYGFINFALVLGGIKLAIDYSKENKPMIEICAVHFDSSLKVEIDNIITNCNNFKIDNGIEQYAYKLKGLAIALENGFLATEKSVWKKEVTSFKMQVNGVLDIMSDNSKTADCRETLQRIENVLANVEYAL